MDEAAARDLSDVAWALAVGGVAAPKFFERAEAVVETRVAARVRRRPGNRAARETSVS